MVEAENRRTLISIFPSVETFHLLPPESTGYQHGDLFIFTEHEVRLLRGELRVNSEIITKNRLTGLRNRPEKPETTLVIGYNDTGEIAICYEDFYLIAHSQFPLLFNYKQAIEQARVELKKLGFNCRYYTGKKRSDWIYSFRIGQIW